MWSVFWVKPSCEWGMGRTSAFYLKSQDFASKYLFSCHPLFEEPLIRIPSCCFDAVLRDDRYLSLMLSEADPYFLCSVRQTCIFYVPRGGLMFLIFREAHTMLFLLWDPFIPSRPCFASRPFPLVWLILSWHFLFIPLLDLGSHSRCLARVNLSLWHHLAR